MNRTTRRNHNKKMRIKGTEERQILSRKRLLLCTICIIITEVFVILNLHLKFIRKFFFRDRSFHKDFFIQQSAAILRSLCVQNCQTCSLIKVIFDSFIKATRVQTKKFLKRATPTISENHMFIVLVIIAHLQIQTIG